jgi:hypothetical protein
MLGNHKVADELFAQGTKWIGEGARWRIRLQYALEAAEYELIRGNLRQALKHFEDAENLMRDELVPLESHYQPLKTLWLYHAGDHDNALSYVVAETTRLKTRVPFTYLTAAAARAWLEGTRFGGLSSDAADAMRDHRWESIAGRKALLEAQGFALPAKTD